MATEILGNVVLLEVDTAGGTSYKTLVCMQDFELGISSSLDTQETDCGQFNVPGTPGATIGFNAVCNAEPGGSELSYEDVLAAAVNTTKCSFRVQNPTQGSLSAGAAFYHAFSGYFNNVRLIKQSAGVIRFSGDITSTGTIDITA